MIRSSILILIAFTFFNQSIAQLTTETRHYFSLKLGASLPTGDYGKTDLDSDKSGYAKTGVAFNMEGAYLFYPSLGLGFNAGFFMNSVDQKNLKSDYDDLGLSNYDLNVTPWFNPHLYIGPVLSFPLDGVSIDLKLMGGLACAISPEEELILRNRFGTSISRMESDTDVSFGYSFGSNIRVVLTEKVGLMFFGEYLSSNHTFDISVSTYSNNYSDVYNIKLEQKITSLTLGLGVIFNL